MWGISYWVFPFISAFVWCGMLIGMIVVWSADGHPVYPWMPAGAHIAYISDIGSSYLQPLFIAGSCVTVVFLDLAFISERWLRHRGRLAKNLTTAEKALSATSMVFALIGSVGLILLSIFKNAVYDRLHNIMLFLFIAGYVVSAICICAEYQRLGIHYREHRVLRSSFWIKLAFILLEVGLAIAFVATSFTSHRDIAAIFEWIVAFVFTFYVLSFIVDLAPAVKTKHATTDKTEMELERNDAASISSRERAIGRSGGVTGDAYVTPARYETTTGDRVINNVQYPQAGRPVTPSQNF